MAGEPVLVMLVEDNVDHAELVLRTLEERTLPPLEFGRWLQARLQQLQPSPALQAMAVAGHA